MEISEITDYVKHTPGNTNQVILEQLVQQYADEHGGSGMEVHVVHFTGVDSSDQSLIADKTPLEAKEGMARGELWYVAGQVLNWEVPMSPISFGIMSENPEELLQVLTCCTLTQIDHGTIKSWPMIVGMLINNKWGLVA